jgi:protoporphyrinogen oxidase
LDKGLQKNIVEDLLEINRRGYAESLDEYNNFESFLIQRFGKTLYELYFKPYNYKIWNFDLSKVPLPWLEGKLPMPDVKSIMLSNIQREEEQEMVHSFFYYPVTGGSQFIIDRLAEGLKILKGTTVFNIEPSGQEWLINKEQKFDIVIYCGDIRSLGSILKTEDSNISGLLNEVPKFKSNGTSNIFCETDVMDYTWLYLPEANLKAHRIIYTGNLSDDNNRGSQRKTCVVEFSGKVAYENMCQEIKKLPGNLSPLSYNYEPNSYIIHESDNRKKVNSLSSFLESKNIFLAGRFAEWEYYNMDKCIESVIRIKNLHL